MAWRILESLGIRLWKGKWDYSHVAIGFKIRVQVTSDYNPPWFFPGPFRSVTLKPGQMFFAWTNPSPDMGNDDLIISIVTNIEHLRLFAWHWSSQYVTWSQGHHLTLVFCCLDCPTWLLFWRQRTIWTKAQAPQRNHRIRFTTMEPHTYTLLCTFRHWYQDDTICIRMYHV